MHYPHARLLVFAKAPLPGQVKTRLIPVLGATGAAALHARLMHHTLTTAVNAEICPITLWCAPATDHPAFQAWQSHVTLQHQEGADLGARMAHALAMALTESDYAVLIGTDCPNLTAQDLEQACAALEAGTEVVLGPAEDGGYWLIGLRRMHPDLFVDIHWGTDGVLAQTRARAAMIGWRMHELLVRADIDRPADLTNIDKIL